MLLHNPNLKLEYYDDYISILSNLSRDQDLFKDYLSKLPKGDIKKILEHIKKIPDNSRYLDLYNITKMYL